MASYFTDYIYLGIAFFALFLGAVGAYRSHVKTVQFFLPYLGMSGLIFALFFCIADILSLILPDLVTFLLAFAGTFSGLAWWRSNRKNDLHANFMVLFLAGSGFLIWGLSGYLFSFLLPHFLESMVVFLAPVCGASGAVLCGLFYKSLKIGPTSTI